MATPAPHLVDEILEEIFLRLPTPAALARVSTACPRFHRIITERPFLRRFRKLHPPPLLGFACRSGFFPVQAPHPSALLARAFADAADFTYSLLPKCSEEYWAPCDARDGRVLLEERWRRQGMLAVCDPLSRRYVLLPSIPKEMTAQQDLLVDLRPKLAPIGEDEDETSFKVVCMARYESKLVVFVFSSATGKWCITASATWSSLGIAEPLRISWSHSTYLDGCLYLASFSDDKLVVLDTHSMEFSSVDFQTGYHMQHRNQSGQNLCMSTAVDGTKESLEMLTLSGDHSPPYSFYLYHTTQQNNGESSNQWQLKNVMEFPRGRLYLTIGATEGFLFILDIPLPDADNPHEFLPEDDHINFSSLEVKTFELKKVCTVKYKPYEPIYGQPYFGFPPSLSKPSL